MMADPEYLAASGRISGTAPDGVLPSQAIRAMVDEGSIHMGAPLLGDQVQPASLDLRLGQRGWRVRASFLSGRERTVAERLQDFAMHEIDLGPGAVDRKST